jgi:predicted enzyme related to lactoylglutathione lyase
MSRASPAYLEHTAFKVRDIHWHIHFFRKVLGWEVRQMEGTDADPYQVWAGGVQLIADPGFDGVQGCVHHIGVRCADVDAALDAAFAFEGVTHLAKGRHWLVLPEGFIVELLPASKNAVATALTIHPEL